LFLKGIIKSFIFLPVVTFLFVSCTNSAQNNSITSNNFAVKDTCCVKDSVEIVMRSEITCPNCGHKKTERLPTDVCVIKYTCEQCKTELHPKQGDCCVFCTYGTHKCPSKQ